MTRVFTDTSTGIIGAFIRGNPYRKNSTCLWSTGDTLMSVQPIGEGDVVAWRVDGEVYVILDNIFSMHIINDICERLDTHRPFEHDYKRDCYTYYSRPIGRDEVVCITSIEPPESRSL